MQVPLRYLAAWPSDLGESRGGGRTGPNAQPYHPAQAREVACFVERAQKMKAVAGATVTQRIAFLQAALP